MRFFGFNAGNCVVCVFCKCFSHIVFYHGINIIAGIAVDLFDVSIFQVITPCRPFGMKSQIGCHRRVKIEGDLIAGILIPAGEGLIPICTSGCGISRCRSLASVLYKLHLNLRIGFIFSAVKGYGMNRIGCG